MKTKAIFFVLLCIGTLPTFLRSQPTPYRHVGDTIYGRSPIYQYQWWYDEWLASDDSHRGYPATKQEPFVDRYHKIVRYCDMKDDSLTILGIAVMGMCYQGGWDYLGGPHDAFSMPEYLYVYDAYPDSFPLKYEVEWKPTDPHRFMSCTTRDITMTPTDTCCTLFYEGTGLWWIYEYYADEPFTVKDSFYVGGSAFSWIVNRPPIDDTYIFYRDVPCHYFIQEDYLPRNCQSLCETLPTWLYKQWKMDSTDNGYWQWVEMNKYLIIMPIILVDTTYHCPDVAGLRQVNAMGNTVVLQWDTDEEHSGYEISYGPAGIDPDQNTIVSTSMTFININGIDSCTHYDAYIRAKCDFDTIYRSPWSDPIDIFLCGDTNEDDTTTHTTLLEEPTDNTVTLVPNPAEDKVVVYSDSPMVSITLTDSRGRIALTTSTSGNATTLYIKDLSPGVYIVSVNLANKTIVKKIIIK